jgi:diguanylate cyclase (GGDEF)-like protein
MQSGTNKDELLRLIQDMQDMIPSSKIDFYTEKNNIDNRNISLAYDTKKSNLFQEDKFINHSVPILYQSKCLKCHTSAKIDDVAAVINIRFPIDYIHITIYDFAMLIFVLFTISIIALVFILNKYLTKYISIPLESLLKQLKSAVKHDDLKNKIVINTNVKELKELEATFNNHNQKLVEAYDLLDEASNTDSLTGIYNRKKFNELVYYEIKKSKTTEQVFSIVLADLNKFKIINDTYGHDVGDKLLINFVELIKKDLRIDDNIYRIGGDEFIILLPNTTSEGAKQVVENLETILNSSKCDCLGNSLSIEASFGVAQLNKDGDDLSELFKIADENMYKDKQEKHKKCK